MTERPYGSWPSPITAELIVAKSVSIGEAAVGLVDVWWAEARPEEGGRVQIVRHRPGGERVDVLPEGFAARTRVHEYGGGAWCLHQADLVFSNWTDQRLWRLDAGADHPFPLTPEPTHDHGDRYADGRFTADAHWVICVRERHPEGDGEPTNELVAVYSRPRGEIDEPVVLVSGPDFVAAPRVSPDGRHLAWFQWHHPDMPWDGTELHVAELHTAPDGERVISLGPSVVVAGGRDEAVTQPEWTADGDLLFLSDRNDWWNLYRLDAAAVDAAVAAGPAGPAPEAVAVAPIEAEIGVPHWVFDQSRYAVLGDGRILVAYARDGLDHLGVVPVGGGAVVPVRSPFTALSSLRPFGNGAVLVGASPTTEAVVAVIDVPVDRRARRHHRGRDRRRAPAPRPRHRPRVVLVARADPVRHHRRPLRPRPLLPADPPRPRRPGRRGAPRSSCSATAVPPRPPGPSSTSPSSSGPPAASGWST